MAIAHRRRAIVWRGRQRSRLLSSALMLAILFVSGCGGSSKQTTSGVASSGSAPPTYVYAAFGDSLPYGAHCNGCDPYPGVYAARLRATQPHPVEFVNLTENGGTSSSLLGEMKQSDPIRRAISRADIIVLDIGSNDMSQGGRPGQGVMPPFASWRAGTCGGSDKLDCFRQNTQALRANIDGMLTEIGQLRMGKPTAVRVVTGSNEFLSDPVLIRAFGANFGPREGAKILAMRHAALCAAATAHSMKCVDLRPVLNGPSLDKPQDVETQAAMNKVADALLNTGLGELR